jgi:DNA-binding CsgD family transcriptional regulator
MDPSNWQATLCDIVDATGARSGAMLVARPGNTVLAAGVGVAPESVDSYNEHYYKLDPIAQLIEASPVGTVGSVFEVFSEADRSRSEFYQDWALPTAAGDGVFCRFSDRCDGPGWVQIVAEPPQAFSTPERLGLMRQLAPHLRQAAKFGLASTGEAPNARLTTDVLAHLERGALLVDHSGTVQDMNPAARAVLQNQDGLSIDGLGTLSAAFPGSRALLQRVIAQACGRGLPVAAAGSTLITRTSGRREYVLYALPLEHRSPEGHRLALVTIVDPDVLERRPPVDAWRSLYGFTWRETVIAQHVLRGEGLQAVADDLRITLSTVRVHLTHIFEKTGTHRQAELARLLTATGPIFTRGE